MAETCQAIGSTREFRAIYEQHYGFIWSTLHRLGTAAEAVDDAVQDVFVVAYRRRATFAGPSARAWLYGIARRVASNYRRSAHRRRERVRAVRSTQSRTMNEGTREAIEALNRYLAGLSAVDREIFVLAEVEGMTGPEVADLLGRNLHTTYSRIRKLRLNFRAEVSDVAAVKGARPRASAGAWAALTPLLTESAALPATVWTAALSSPWVVAGLSAAVGIGALVIAERLVPESAPSRAETSSLERAALRSDEQAVAPPTQPAKSSPSLAAPSPALRDAASSPSPAVRTGSRAASRPAVESPSSSSSSLAEENALLHEASVAVVGGSMHEALQLTKRHGEQFAKSAFADLRSAIRIEALCGLGKRVQARGEAALFRRRFPGSPAAVRVEKSCAGPSQMARQPDKRGI